MGTSQPTEQTPREGSSPAHARPDADTDKQAVAVEDAERERVGTYLEWEIERVADETSRPGWTPWALVAGLGWVLWQVLALAALQPPTSSTRLFRWCAVLGCFLSGVTLLHGALAADGRGQTGRLRRLSELEVRGTPLLMLLAEYLYYVVVFACAYSQVGWGVLPVAVLSGLVVVVLALGALIDGLVSVPMRAEPSRALGIAMGAVHLGAALVAGRAVSLWLLLKSSSQEGVVVQELRMAGLLVVAFLLLKLLARADAPPPLLATLVTLRRDVALSSISPRTALDHAEIALRGMTAARFAQEMVVDSIALLDNYRKKVEYARGLLADIDAEYARAQEPPRDLDTVLEHRGAGLRESFSDLRDRTKRKFDHLDIVARDASAAFSEATTQIESVRAKARLVNSRELEHEIGALLATELQRAKEANQSVVADLERSRALTLAYHQRWIDRLGEAGRSAP